MCARRASCILGGSACGSGFFCLGGLGGSTVISTGRGDLFVVFLLVIKKVMKDPGPPLGVGNRSGKTKTKNRESLPPRRISSGPSVQDLSSEQSTSRSYFRARHMRAFVRTFRMPSGVASVGRSLAVGYGNTRALRFLA